MRDKLLYLTIGLLVGFVVMQWGVSSNTIVVPVAQAGYVPDGTGIISSAIARNSAIGYALGETGQRWRVDPVDGWAGPISIPPDYPVPVSDMKFWSSFLVITHSDELWTYSTQTGDPYYGVWHNWGPWPGGQPVPTDNSSWGVIKNKLKKEGD